MKAKKQVGVCETIKKMSLTKKKNLTYNGTCVSLFVIYSLTRICSTCTCPAEYYMLSCLVKENKKPPHRRFDHFQNTAEFDRPCIIHSFCKYAFCILGNVCIYV